MINEANACVDLALVYFSSSTDGSSHLTFSGWHGSITDFFLQVPALGSLLFFLYCQVSVSLWPLRSILHLGCVWLYTRTIVPLVRVDCCVL